MVQAEFGSELRVTLDPKQMAQQHKATADQLPQTPGRKTTVESPSDGLSNAVLSH